MPFIKSNPEETKRELERLAQTEEGARAIRDFNFEYEFRSKLIEARKQAKLSERGEVKQLLDDFDKERNI